MKILHSLLAFNRGLVSKLALARNDVTRINMSAEKMVNWMPRVMGSMMLRPGTKYLHETHNNATSVTVPFVYAVEDTARVEITNGIVRVALDGTVITRESVSTAVTNGGFDTDLTGWTDNDQSGGVSVWATGGYMSLSGDGTNEARRDQQITVAVGDLNKEHGIKIHVSRGSVICSIGSTAGGGEYLNQRELRQGYHSLSVTPTGDIHIRLASSSLAPVLVNSVSIEAGGPMTITAPWTESDLDKIRYEQSADVLFIACKDRQQMRIERQDTRSWSVVYYQAEGPYRNQNTSSTTITPSALNGSITLTASKSIFKTGHVGAVFKLESSGQYITDTITGEDQFTSPIRVVGVGSSRDFGIVLAGTWVASVKLQRSLGDVGDWTDVATYTTNQSITYNDALSNQIAYYRIGIKAGGYTSGSVEVDLSYSAGSIVGVARVVEYISGTQVYADVETDLGATTATSIWWEGAWSDYRGWPSAVVLHEGRLWWAGKDRIDGSVSDDYANFNDEIEGDSGPIYRSIGAGPVDTINWLLSMPQMVVGGQGAEYVAKASSLEEPLTPTSFSLRPVSQVGSASVRVVKLDNSGVYVSRGGTRVYEVAFDTGGYNYSSSDLTGIIPEIGEPSIVRMVAQRLPDTRVHCVRSDGTVAILIFDRFEKVTCWINWETEGDVEDVTVLPGDIEDRVYYTIKRTINGVTKRYVEKWALESEGRGESANILSDSTYTYSGASTATITGLSHLEGKSVVAWGNTKDLGTYTVSGGQITLSEAVTSAYIGLPYTAQFKSAKLAVASQAGAPLTQRKRIDHLAVVLYRTHYQGLRYGQSLDYLDELPLVEYGVATSADTIHEDYDEDSFELNGTWDTDARLCLEAESPRPCTILAAVIGMAGHDK